MDNMLEFLKKTVRKAGDMAAGTLIAKEAGAQITELDGSDWELFSDSILIANPGLHKILKGIFNE